MRPRQADRGIAERVGEVRIGAPLEQQLDDREALGQHGLGERRRAVLVRAVDRPACVEQGHDDLAVAVLRGGMQAAAIGPRRRAGPGSEQRVHGREVTLLHLGQQAPDHPVPPAFSEGSYLKTAFLGVT
mgnify:CR=1 FL=1